MEGRLLLLISAFAAFFNDAAIFLGGRFFDLGGIAVFAYGQAAILYAVFLGERFPIAAGRGLQGQILAAAGKGVFSYVCHAFRDRDAFQAAAAGERFRPDAGHASWDDRACEAAAALECFVPDALYGMAFNKLYGTL